MRNGMTLTVSILLLAARLAAAVSEPEAQAIVKAQLEGILGAGVTVRDFAPFETERGEGAMLVLYATDTVEPPEDAPIDAASWDGRVRGVPLLGRYHVALVVHGRLVNAVVVPAPGDPPSGPFSPLELPLFNRARDNKRFYGRRPTLPIAPVERTRLVRLADYDGDGNAWEFRLVQPAGCSRLTTLLAGYSAQRRQAIVHPIVGGAGQRFWETDLFTPVPRRRGTARRTTHAGCDGGSERRRKFRYDPRREAWVQMGERRRSCELSS